MTAYIGLGSNVGDRRQNLEQALKEMEKLKLSVLKVSPIYENPALLKAHAPEEWNRPFLNTVAQIQCDNKSPEQLLFVLQKIEQKLGRAKRLKWAPRVIDLDILLFKDKVINTSNLQIPHLELSNRNFAITPLKELQANLKIPSSHAQPKIQPVSESAREEEKHTTALTFFRQLKIKLPTWMFIINITPDSFSDGGETNLSHFESILRKLSDYHIHILDLGAESTRPGAKPVSPSVEWQRLKPYIEKFHNYYRNKTFRPKLSVDTRHAQTAKKALDKGVDIINDVSGLSREMLDLLKKRAVEYVLMHSVTVPADRSKTLPLDKDPVEEIKQWLEKKINILNNHNIHLDRIIFDPGIGFGKTAGQSLEILKRIKEFYCFPLRIMVGHSRKSFMKNIFAEQPIAEQSFAKQPIAEQPIAKQPQEIYRNTKKNVFAEQPIADNPAERDPESAGVSVFLAGKGVDILRVHRADFHARVFRGFLEGSSL